MRYFDELHRVRFNGVPAVLTPGKDGKILARLHATHSAYLRPIMSRFFAERGTFQEHAGFSIGVLSSQFARLLTGYLRDEARAARFDWETECNQLHGGTCPTAFVHDARTVRKPA